jgi:hypothetical protein
MLMLALMGCTHPTALISAIKLPEYFAAARAFHASQFAKLIAITR